MTSERRLQVRSAAALWLRFVVSADDSVTSLEGLAQVLHGGAQLGTGPQRHHVVAHPGELHWNRYKDNQSDDVTCNVMLSAHIAEGASCLT